MKAWHVKPYWTKRVRMLDALRKYHYEQLRNNLVPLPMIEKKLKIIDNLSKRIP